MSIREEIVSLKSRALQRIGEAAEEGDTRIIVAATRIVQEAERMREVFDELVSEMSRLLKDFENLYHSKGIEISTSSETKMSPRMIGRLRKEAFINDLRKRNIKLTFSKDSILTTEDGKLIGVAYSSEHLPGKWWLGIRNDNYETVAKYIVDFA